MVDGDSEQNAPMSSQDETQESEAKDESQAVDAPDEGRLAELGERIDKARSKAEDAGVLVDEDEEHFVDSGATEADDDQTIAPPG